MTDSRTSRPAGAHLKSIASASDLGLKVPTFGGATEGQNAPPTLPDAWVSRRSGDFSPKEYGRKNIVAYLRSSTPDQVTSIPAQLREAGAYATKIGGQLIHTSIDEGRTGTTTFGRGGIEEALGFIERGEADILLVFRASRAARDPGDLLAIFSRIEDAEGEFHTVDRGRMSDADALFEAAYSKFEIKRMRAQLDAGVRNCIMEGRVPHGPSYGYVRHVAKPGHHMIAEQRAQHIRKAFVDRANGVPVSVIARELQEAGVPTPKEASKIDYEELEPSEAKCYWSSHLVLALFRKPIYMGIITWRKTKRVKDPKTKETVRVKKQPKSKWISFYNPRLKIVDPMIWHRVNAMIAGNLKNSQMRPELFPRFLFTGRIFCADVSPVNGGCRCGGPYHVRGGHYPQRMQCVRAVENPDRCRATKRLEYKKIEGVVLKEIGTHVITREGAQYYAEVYAKAQTEAHAERDAERARLLKQIATDQALLDASFDAIIMSSFDPEEAAYQRQRVTERQKETQRKLAALEESAAAAAPDLTRLDSLVKGWDAIIAEGIDTTTSEGARLAHAIRLLVKRIDIVPPDDAGEVHGTIEIDLAGLLGDTSGAMPASSGTSLSFSYNAVAELKATLAQVKAARCERREQEASEGRFDISDAQWSVIEPLMAQLPFEPTGGARNLICGMMFLVKSETHYTKMPSRWGTPKTFKKELGRFSRSGLLEKVVEELGKKAPEAIYGFDLGRVKTDRFKYNPGKAEKPRFALAATDFLAAAEGKSEAVRMRCQALHKLSLGEHPDDVARDLQMSDSWVLTHLNRFEHYGMEALEDRKWMVRSLPCRLQTDDEEMLVLKIRDGSNPYGEPTWNRKMIIRYALEEYGIVWTQAILTRWLKKRGISLSEIALKLALQRAGLPRDPHGQPMTKDPVKIGGGSQAVGQDTALLAASS